MCANPGWLLKRILACCVNAKLKITKQKEKDNQSIKVKSLFPMKSLFSWIVESFPAELP